MEAREDSVALDREEQEYLLDEQVRKSVAFIKDPELEGEKAVEAALGFLQSHFPGDENLALRSRVVNRIELRDKMRKNEPVHSSLVSRHGVQPILRAMKHAKDLAEFEQLSSRMGDMIAAGILPVKPSTEGGWQAMATEWKFLTERVQQEVVEIFKGKEGPGVKVPNVKHLVVQKMLERVLAQNGSDDEVVDNIMHRLSDVYHRERGKDLGGERVTVNEEIVSTLGEQ